MVPGLTESIQFVKKMLNPDGESMTLLLARAREVLSLSETIITFTAESFGHDALYSQADLMVSTVHAAANKLLVAFMGKDAVDLKRATFQTKVNNELLAAYQVMDYPAEICALMQAEKFQPPHSTNAEPSWASSTMSFATSALRWPALRRVTHVYVSTHFHECLTTSSWARWAWQSCSPRRCRS